MSAYIVDVGWSPFDFEGDGHQFVHVLDITEPARDSMKQMMVKLTARDNQYSELIRQTERNIGELQDRHKFERLRLEAARGEQVSGFNI